MAQSSNRGLKLQELWIVKGSKDLCDLSSFFIDFCQEIKICPQAHESKAQSVRFFMSDQWAPSCVFHRCVEIRATWSWVLC